jgi:hypothetical protein
MFDKDCASTPHGISALRMPIYLRLMPDSQSNYLESLVCSSSPLFTDFIRGEINVSTLPANCRSHLAIKGRSSHNRLGLAMAMLSSCYRSKR